jgi:hypothetical protein
MSASHAAQTTFASKIAEVCINLKPFQSLEFDPIAGVVTIVTELLVPSHDTGQVAEIVARRRADEKILVSRYADTYKIALTRQIKL